jgi:hypothetical protein
MSVRVKTRIRLCPAANVDSAAGWATLGRWAVITASPPIAAPDDDHVRVEADQRFQAALAQAIAKGGERVEAVEATVALKRRTKLSR